MHRIQSLMQGDSASSGAE